MNFEHMPELDERWAYPRRSAVMAIGVIGLVTFFRRIDWL